MVFGGKRVGPAGAALVAWLALALLNQVLIAASAAGAPLGTLLLHRLFDAGQLVAAGVASFAGVELGRRALARFPRLEGSRVVRAAALGTVVFAVSLATVENDVTNAAGRYGVPVWLAVTVASLCFAIVLGSTVFVRALPWPMLRLAAAVSGFGVAVTNAFVLPKDYPALHLFLSWLAALLVAHGVEGFVPALELSPRARRAGLVLLGAGGVLALAVPPPQAVRVRLFELSSAVLAPFAARLAPDRSRAEVSRVPEALARSPWFASRKRLPPVEPTRALALPDSPIVMLLIIDAMRADLFDTARGRRRLPALTSLRRKGANFSAARAPASSTRPSIASLFTGRYANQLKWQKRDGETHLTDSGPRLAELLSGAGVATVSLPLLKRTSREFGVGRGFQREYRHPFSAKEIVDRIIDLSKGFEGPTFLYAHIGELHAPYVGKGTPRERYGQEAARVDRELARLVRYLDESGLSSRTLLVVSADHGEAFGEHGVGNHATIVYEEVARIPLIVSGPGVVSRNVSVPVGLIDLTPTILDLFGLPAPGAFMGQSLAPLLAGRDQTFDRPLAVSSSGSLDALYVPGGTLKVIFDAKHRTTEVYDLEQDAGELRNLVDTSDPEVERAIETAKLFFDVHSRGGRERIPD
ncbi:MAG TPA: sulfatase [Polyangiaceae bacterium]